jgi:hypothetical protein
LKITKDCVDFFTKEGNLFKVNQLMNIFFYIEHLCFKDLCNNLQPDFKISIDNETAEKIKKKLINEVNKEKEIYSIKDLAAAVRRFISRYLVGNRQDVEIDEKRQLYFELTRLDLWEEKFGQLDNLEELIQNQLAEFKLNVGQAFSLYDIIGEEDKNYIQEYIDKIGDEVDVQDKEESNIPEESKKPEELKDQKELEESKENKKTDKKGEEEEKVEETEESEEIEEEKEKENKNIKNV